MTTLEDFLIPKSAARTTTLSHISEDADDEIKEALQKYLPDPFLNVGTKIITEKDGKESIVLDMSISDGWSQATFDVMSSLRYRVLPNTEYLLARPNNPDGSLAAIPKLKLYHASMTKVEGDKVITVFQWMPLIEGKQADYVFSCWSW